LSFQTKAPSLFVIRCSRLTMKALALWTQSFIAVLALSLPLDAAPNTAPSFTLPAGVNNPAGEHYLPGIF
jgi:hypothetical protein